jgi:hypothetical protein
MARDFLRRATAFARVFDFARTEFRWHIIRLEEKRAPPLPTSDQVKDAKRRRQHDECLAYPPRALD